MPFKSVGKIHSFADLFIQQQTKRSDNGIRSPENNTAIDSLYVTMYAAENFMEGLFIQETNPLSEDPSVTILDPPIKFPRASA